MFRLYRQAASLWWTSLPFLLLMAAVLDGIALVSPTGVSGGVGTLVAQTYLIWMFHRAFLYDENMMALKKAAKDLPKRPFLRFALIFFAILMPCLVTMVLLASAAAETPQTNADITGLTVIVLSLPVFFLTLALGGTLLPASIDRDPRFTFGKALRPSPRLLMFMIAGPLVSTLLLIAATIVTLPLIPTAASKAIDFAHNAILRTLGFFPSALTAAILCDSYRRIVPALAAPPRTA